MQIEKKNKKQMNIGIYEDVFSAITRAKTRLGYKSYSAVIDTLLDEFEHTDLSKVEVGERNKGKYMYLAISKNTYERLTALYKKYRMTYDMIVYKLLKLKNWI
ncbi:MAG: hypothetical protein QW607_05810 [Desulfurococcaceae archaeon]